MSHITIRLMDLPGDVRSDAFTYLVYEMNRFGPSYLGVCSQLLSLDWLYAPRVKENLGKLFGVTLSH